MKELSIEQKAKAYDEALEKSKILYEQGTITENLAYIFPELTESEDERIRKDILTAVKEAEDSLYVIMTPQKQEKWTAWLEKQGQTFTKKDVDDAYLKGIYDAKQELEKQGEQKPAANVELKFKVKYAGSEYNVFEVKDIAGVTFYGIEDEPNHIDYVKAENCEIISGYGVKENGLSFPTKPVMFSEQKSAWSEEDEQRVENLLAIIEGHGYPGEVAWLKSIKDRVVPQPKQEWKPSDEQMITLRHVISGCSYDIEPLAEMEEHLKKLREEDV